MKLSPCEQLVLRGLSEGLLCKEIAAREGWSENLPHIYAHRAKRKLRARTRVQAVVRFMMTLTVR